MLILPKIEEALSSQFIKWQPVAEILSLSYTMRKPCILFGRGGHGKSEMVRAVFRELAATNSDIFIQSCGEGMTEAKLYGGLDMKLLNDPENPSLQFCPELSFLAKKFVLLEEIFDAPPSVLLSLKDTLTDKQLNNGNQIFPMQTRFLVAATNKRPAEISELGDSAHALTERFPLQLCVEWESYNKADFEELFDKTSSNWDDEDTWVSPDIRSLLAQLIAEAHTMSEWISPRQAVVCLDAVRASAIINERNEAIEEDILGIKFIPGVQAVVKKFAANLNHIAHTTRIMRELDRLETEIKTATSLLEISKKTNDILKVRKSLSTIDVELTCIETDGHDVLDEKRRKLRALITEVLTRSKAALLGR